MPTEIITLSQFIKLYPAFTMGGLRALIFHANTNGFNKVIKRFSPTGRRGKILIDVTAFLNGLKNNRKEMYKMRKDYFIIYNGIAQEYKLSPIELLIFSYTLNFKEKLIRSENQLASLFNVSKSTIHKAIRRLIKINLLGSRKVKIEMVVLTAWKNL